MKIGLLGDIHAEHRFLERALEFYRKSAMDLVLAVGDIVDGEGDADTCLDLLRKNAVQVVKGNHDRWFLGGQMRQLPDATPAESLDPRNHDYLALLPKTLELESPLGPMLLCHGTGDDDMAAVRPDDFGYALEFNEALQSILGAGKVKVLVSGHSHRRMVRKISGLTLINAGTLARHHSPCFATIDFGRREVAYYEERTGGELVVSESLPLLV